MSTEAPAKTPPRTERWSAGVLLMVVVAFALRLAWPMTDPPLRFSWSTGIYTDPAVMVHAARNASLFGEWIADYNRDLFVFPLMNWLTFAFYQLFGGPGRLPTLVIAALAGTITVALIAFGLRRSFGPRAAWIGAALAALAHFPVMFSRIPVAENVTAAVLTAAAVLAISATPLALAGAGALGVFATLFGKYHAIGWLPGLFLFVMLRHRRPGLIGAFLGGGTLVFLAWLAFLFLPHQQDILSHVSKQSTGHGDLPLLKSIFEGVGEFFNTIRRSWMFYRIPIIGALGGFFWIWTLGNSNARRARLADGSAVWAFVFASQWIYLGLLPYKAPRYFVLIAPALIAGAAVVLELALRRTEWKLRAPQRWDEHLPLALGLFAFFFTAIDAVKHYVAMGLEYALAPPAKISQGLYHGIVDVFAHVDTFEQGLLWGGAFAILAYILILWHPEIFFRGERKAELSGRRLRSLASAAIVAASLIGSIQWIQWSFHRTTFLEDVKASVPAMVGEDAVILGPLAPVLTQDTELRCYPYYGPPGHRGLLEKYGVTHVTVSGKGDEEVLNDRFPDLFAQTTTVQVWPMKTLFASTLKLQRLPAVWNGVPIHGYERTLFESASDAATSGQFREAIELFGEYRRRGGADIPEVISLEAVCWFKLEDYDRAEKLLDEAIRRRPFDPLNYRNLGVLHLRRGDRAAALEAFMTGLRIDDKNEELVKMVEELTR